MSLPDDPAAAADGHAGSTAPAVLPPLYAGWLDELLAGPIPAETRATCHDCAMACKPGKTYAPEEVHYEPDLKCCTYYPDLSNFAVGRILRDPVCVGRDEVLHRIECGTRVTPMGIGRPPMYGAVYQKRTPETFGRSRRLRCSFLTPLGQCGIWEHREAVCATYFCKLDRGAVGKRFWSELQRLLYLVERELALHCVLALELGDDALRHLFEDHGDQLDMGALEGFDDPERRRLRWGRFAGQEQAFYEEAAALVDGLSWGRVLDICGPGVRAHARALRAAHDALRSPALPVRLRSGAYHLAHGGGGRTRLVGYSRLDALEVPTRAVPALLRFDGRPTDEVLAALPDDAGLDRATVRALVDFEILVPATGAAGAPVAGGDD